MRAEVTPPEETVTAILFWRAALLLYYVENLFERLLESMRIRSPTYLAKVMRLASFAQRLSLVLPEMKVFNMNLYLRLVGRNNVNMTVEVELPADTVTAVLIWRAALILYYAEGQFERPLMSLRTRPPIFLYEFDGSLIAWGGRMFQLGPMLEERLLWTTSLADSQGVVQRIHSHTHPSSYQNAMERISFILVPLAELCDPTQSLTSAEEILDFWVKPRGLLDGHL